ncbi:MAG: deoxyribonuclease IV [Rudaea sp.]
MRIGAHVSIAGGADLAVDRGIELGCEAIQIFTKNNNQWRAAPLTSEVVDRFHTKLGDSDIHPVVAHTSYLINLGTPDPALWEKSFESFETELERCERLGVHYLVTHPGSHMGAGTDRGIENLARAINKANARHPEYRVVTLIEQMAGQGTNLCGSLEQVAQVIDLTEDKKRVGVCLDTAHLFAAGFDYRSAEKYAATIKTINAVVGLERVKCIHLNDSKTALGSKVDRHEAIGKGKIGKIGFQLFLQDRRFRNTPGLLETPTDGTGKYERLNLRMLRKLREKQLS